MQGSLDPLDHRVAALVELEGAARGFLDVPLIPHVHHDEAVPVYAAGQTIGPYCVVSLLGQGGMGQVYLADDTRLLRQVALKVLTGTVAHASLLREARMVARLHHSNIATIYDVLEAHGRLHIVMELLEGRTLGDRQREGRVAATEAAGYVRQILEAVRHAHSKGVIHCDLKPANVFILPANDIKVLDFGLARLDAPSMHTVSMGLAGTPRFLAPERLLGQPPGAQTDVYSVGVILADLLIGAAESSASADTKPLAVPPQDLHIHKTLIGVAATAMAPDPTLRYASAAEMQSALDAALHGVTGPASKSRPTRVRPSFAAAAATLALIVVGALGYLTTPRQSGERPVLALKMSAVGADAMSGHIAAALEQLLLQSLGRSSDLVMVRQAPPVSDQAIDVGATHVLLGSVQRNGNALDITFSLTTSKNVPLASQSARAALTDPQVLAEATINGTELALRRGGLRVTRDLLDPIAVRRALSVNAQAFEEYAQAREYMRTPEVAGNADYAIGLLARAIERDPQFVLAHASLAEAYWQKYQVTRDETWTDRARSAALEAVRLNPDEPTVRYTLAIIYRGMGRYQDALNEVNRAVALQPTSDDLYRMRGRLQADLGRTAEALDDLATARTLRPGYWDNHRTTGLVLFEAGRYEDAVPHFRRLAELRPNNGLALQQLGTALHAAGRTSEALETYYKALSIAPHAMTHANIAKIHYDNGRYEDAAMAYEEAVRLDPRRPVTHRNLGDVFAKLGLTGRSRDAYETAIALTERELQVNASDLQSLSLQAICHAKLGHREQAVRLAANVLAADKIAATTRYRAGVTLILAGEIDRGVDAVARALADGHSRSEAALDEDLASVASDPRLKAALEKGTS